MKYKYLNFPRPNFRRNFISLNGNWEFFFENGDVGERKPRYIEFPNNHLTINVPFCYQSKLSGIHETKKFETVWYHKQINVSFKKNQRVIIHFGAADYLSKLYINHKFVGSHEGGYTEFNFDITKFIEKDIVDIVVSCNDTYRLTQPRGKQKWKDESFGCWYQEVTGIWRSVWIEIVEDSYILDFKITPLVDNYISFNVDFNKTLNGKLRILVFDSSKEIKNVVIKVNSKNINKLEHFKNLKVWDFGSPNLYDVKFILEDNNGKILDEVSTYFGYRIIDIKNGKFYLNNKFSFLRLVLEQGYYIKGIYTFENEDEIIKEVNLIKSLGFNGLRMHQKVEDPRFYYLCDAIGLYVWSEMPSSYEFDEYTILSTTSQWKEVLREHYNHPSIIVWTPLNECWGVPGIRYELDQQRFANSLYDLTKSFDKTRPVISDDGWLHCKTDIVTLHNYVQDPNVFKNYINNVKEIVLNNGTIDQMNSFVPFADGYEYKNQPIMFTEFCGIGFNVEDTKSGWGYGKSVKDQNSFIERYKGLIDASNRPDLIAGWCVTQLSDVYQEVNGLVTMKRVPKVDKRILYKINSYIK